jgi:hypothetical protein
MPPASNCAQGTSLPQRELLGFIQSVSGLIGGEKAEVLTELWLDELASMDATPEPTSSDWRRVTLAASARLARQLIDVQLKGALPFTIET